MDFQSVDAALEQLRLDVVTQFDRLANDYADVIRCRHKTVSLAQMEEGIWNAERYLPGVTFDALQDAIENGITERVKFMEALSLTRATNPRELLFLEELAKFVPVFNFLNINGIKKSVREKSSEPNTSFEP